MSSSDEVGARDRKATSEYRARRAQTVLSLLIVLVGIALLVAGVVAAFVSSNSSASAVLIGVGAASLMAIVFRDRIQEAKLGGFEIKLAAQMKDQLRHAFFLKVRGNYESSEWELGQAFARFVGELTSEQYREYNESKEYEAEVYEKLKDIVPDKFGGQIRNSSARHSFYPLVDAVLRLDGTFVRESLESQQRKLCQSLLRHLNHNKQLRVGVTIRPGPELEARTLAQRLHDNVKNGALDATCFLLIQNCRDEESGRRFRWEASQLGMHAASVVWPTGGTVEELGAAITDAILAICTEETALDSRADGLSGSVPDPSAPIGGAR